jgi:hypothetical protein
MKSTSFPNCCTATVLYDFGGTALSAGDKTFTSAKVIRNYLRKEMDAARDYHCLVVMTNSEQEVANKVLLEMGFEHSPWMRKYQHSESKIRLWWLPPLDRKGPKNG